MKGRTTLLLAAAFLALLAVVLFLDRNKTGDGAGPGEKLAEIAAENAEEITFKNAAETVTLARTGPNGWMITSPLETPADPVEVSSLLYALSDLRIERVVETESADLQKYEIPTREISLKMKGADKPVKISFGAENAVDGTFFARKEGDPRVVLLSRTLKPSLEKKLFDFRRKDVFRFETGDVARIRLVSGDVRWEAQKTGTEWFLETPMKALAKDMEISALLDSLAGLRATEFAVEAKKPGAPEKAGLDRPETIVTLSFTSPRKDLVFAFQKVGEKTYATNSESPLIVVPETDPSGQLAREADAFRETRVAVFNSWEALALSIKKDGLDLVLSKSAEGKWSFASEPKGEADSAKVESFLRTVESLAATEIIDRPKSPAAYGLD
ncbi:MAG: DUF4340 domain-containing protein, partial [Candidatus Aminicenantales bacterium]